MAKPRNDTPKTGFLRDEVIGLLVLGASLMALLALVSHDPDDGSWCASAPAGVAANNYLGRVGAELSCTLHYVLGLAAYVVPVLLAWIAASYFLRRGFPIRAQRAIGAVILLLSACGLLDLDLTPWARESVGEKGGLLGLAIGQGLSAVVAPIGAHVVLVLMFLVGIVLAVRVTVSGATAKAYGVFGRAAARVGSSIVVAFERARRRRERRRGKPDDVPPVEARPKRSRKAAPEIEPEAGEEPPSPAWEAPRITTGTRREESAVSDESVEEPDTDFVADGPLEEDETEPEPEIRVIPPAPEKPAAPAKPPRQFSFPEFSGTYELPPLDLLDAHTDSHGTVDRELLVRNSRALEEKLAHFDVDGKVVEVRPGPIVTMYEYEPAPGVRVTKVANLDRDLALALKASRIRIVAPLPERGTIGIEVPNRDREVVYLREILESAEFQESKAKIPIAIGKDIFGRPSVTDLAEMPHLLVAGTTGSGKSVFLNCVVLSLLYKHTPEQVRILLVDPKMLEFQDYDGIPSLVLPVVTNVGKASAVLRQAVEEMERRYHLMADMGVRDLEGYNAKVDKKNANPEMRRVYSSDDEGREIVDEEPILLTKLPYVVLIIDEFADLMMVAPKDIMESVQRLAQMARAAGIHLILATQRPSKDVITGDIKANMAARITFQLRTKTDSRVILDCNGAESLLGMGDMLFLPSKNPKLQRLHGAYVSEREIKRVIEFVRRAGGPMPVETVFTAEENGGAARPDEDGDFFDEKYEDAKRLVKESERATISYVQRILKVGYNRAARMIEQMERDGLISAPDHQGNREIYAEKF
jgi:S-DNA-T family DNA segregation ATPase FtsK/SpoIIIE